MFISARVDRWSAAARLLIGASPPVSHTHIDSLSSLLVQQPSCTPQHRSSLISSSSSLLLFLSVPFFLFFYLSFSPLASVSLRRYFRPLGLSAAVCLPIISLPPPPPLRHSYSVLRFSPCRPIIRSLFTLIFSFVSRPHTRKPRNLHYFPRTYTLSSFPTRLPNSDAFFLPF